MNHHSTQHPRNIDTSLVLNLFVPLAFHGGFLSETRQITMLETFFRLFLFWVGGRGQVLDYVQVIRTLALLLCGKGNIKRVV